MQRVLSLPLQRERGELMHVSYDGVERETRAKLKLGRGESFLRGKWLLFDPQICNRKS